MKKLLTASCTLLSACALYAESTWVATIEVESLNTLQLGVEAFCKSAEIPIPPEVLSSTTRELLTSLLPHESMENAVSFKDPVRVFLFENSEQPISQGGDPEYLFALTLAADPKVIQDQLAKLYTARRDGGNVITFSAPADVDTDLPANMLLSIGERNKALLTMSKDALAWFQQQQKLDDFLPMPGSQTLRTRLNTKFLASVFPQEPELAFFAKIMDDVDYISLAITPNAQAIALTYGLRFKKGSVIATLLDALKPPKADRWNGVPENAFLAYVGQDPTAENVAKFVKTYLEQDIPVDPINVKIDESIERDVVRYLTTTADKKGLRYIDISPLKDGTGVQDAIKEAIKTLEQIEVSPGAKLKTEEARKFGEQTVERYSLSIDMAAALKAQGMDPTLMAGNPAMMIVPMLTKGIVFEYTVKDNYLISAVSPAGATDNWIPAIPFAVPAITLDKKVAAVDPNAKVQSAFEFSLTPFLKQVVSMLPNVKPEHLNLFSAKTDAIQIWTATADNNVTAVTLRVPANEVASISKIATNGQAALQEIMFALFAAQMQLMAPPAATPPPNF